MSRKNRAIKKGKAKGGGGGEGGGGASKGTRPYYLGDIHVGTMVWQAASQVYTGQWPCNRVIIPRPDYLDIRHSSIFIKFI